MKKQKYGLTFKEYMEANTPKRSPKKRSNIKKHDDNTFHIHPHPTPTIPPQAQGYTNQRNNFPTRIPTAPPAGGTATRTRNPTATYGVPPQPTNTVQSASTSTSIPTITMQNAPTSTPVTPTLTPIQPSLPTRTNAVVNNRESFANATLKPIIDSIKTLNPK